MSHELRTPLNSLLILAKLLARQRRADAQRQAGRVRPDHPRRGQRPARADQPDPRSVQDRGRQAADRDARAVRARRAARLRGRQLPPGRRAEGAGLQRCSIAPDAPAALTTDSQRLQQILKNLLSNALQVHREGPGRAARSSVVAPEHALHDRRRCSRPRRVVAFSVTDTGIGIPDDKQQLIFEAFQQADASTSRMYGGTGLGLTISRELAQLLGGELEVKSSVGRRQHVHPVPAAVGSRPRRRATPTSRSKRWTKSRTPLRRCSSRRRVRSPSCVGRKVLMIDDDARNLFAVTSLLERAGMSVVSASTAQEGLGALKDNPDVDRGADGHHVAGHGRLPGDARDPRHAGLSSSCRSSRLPPRRCPVTAKSASKPAAPTSCPSRWTPTS